MKAEIKTFYKNEKRKRIFSFSFPLPVIISRIIISRIIISQIGFVQYSGRQLQ
jgi:hypothetical protein